MRQVAALREIGWRDIAAVGGKAANCARLLQAGFAVPDGIVITAAGAGRETALAELVSALQRWPQDTLLAVRSSAVDEDSPERSFAGMHETRLNVARPEVPEAVHACWASVQAGRAAAYRETRGSSADEIRIAVLVQPMVPARAAGVAFTRNPVSGADETVINAVAGLGEALVSGRVQPDQWRIGHDGRVLSAQPSGTGSLVLADEQVKELAALAARIERLFGAPQDIEWCHDGRRFWVVQSRPITAIAGTAPDIEWTRANVREVMPDLPAPQVVDTLCPILDRAQRDYGGRMYAPASELGPTAKAICGRPYFNLSQLRYAMRLLGRAPAQMMRVVGYSGPIPVEDEQVGPRPWRRFVRALPDLARIMWWQFRVGSLVRFNIEHVAPEMEKIWPPSIDSLSDEQVADGFADRHVSKLVRGFRPIFALTGVIEYEDRVRKLLRQAGVKYEDLALPCLAAGEKSVSAQQAFDLLRLAAAARPDAAVSSYFRETGDFGRYREALAGSQFLRAFDRFLEQYGHRGIYESDWSLPRYAEDPRPLLQAVQAHVRAESCPSADAIERQQEAQAQAAWQRFEARLNRWQRLTLAPLLRRLLERIKRMYAWRELYRSEMMRQMAKRRRWHLAIANRFLERGWIAARDDYFMLTMREIEQALRGSEAAELKNIVAQRRGELEAWQRMDMPLRLRDSEIPHLRPSIVGTPGSRLEGMCVSPGQAEGEVVVLHSPRDFARMKPRAIIVAPATDPAWTPLFTLAAGVIVEIGGLLSHASIVAREYGLPALANVPDATRVLRDGDCVRLDATSGTVDILATGTRGASATS